MNNVETYATEGSFPLLIWMHKILLMFIEPVQSAMLK